VGPSPRLHVTPASKDWGAITLGTSWFHVISIANLGDRPLHFERLVVTDDPRHPRIEVPLTGEGDPPPPCDGLSPARVDFGQVPHGLSASARVTVRNCGDGPMHVTSVRSDAEAFQLPPEVDCYPGSPGLDGGSPPIPTIR
jgi:hypothetical protein